MNRSYIGKELHVTRAANSTLTGMRGRIIMETKNTLVLNTPRGRRTLLKKGCLFQIGSEMINGTLIQKRPEDRIKIFAGAR